LAQAWNRWSPEPFRLDASDVRRGVADSPAACLEFRTVVADNRGGVAAWAAFKRSPSGWLYPGGDPSRWHLSIAGGEPAALLPLVEEGISACAAGGAGSVQFGGDPDHFFPGVPERIPALERLAASTGFQVAGEVSDLWRDLAGYRPPSDAASALRHSGTAVERCTAGSVDRLDAFLASEFPGRWRADCRRKAVADGEPGDVFVLRAGDAVCGFAVTQTPRSVRPHAGAVFRRAFGSRWAALGPIGVAKAFRGRGLGDALLASALGALAEGGAQGCVVDWTVLLDFYGRHGFEPIRRYWVAERRLTPD
jgi:ribosomal protein S18 acetylase RimI-like enzyme